MDPVPCYFAIVGNTGVTPMLLGSYYSDNAIYHADQTASMPRTSVIRRSGSTEYGSPYGIRRFSPMVERAASQIVNNLRRNSLFSTPNSNPGYAFPRTPLQQPKKLMKAKAFRLGFRGTKVKAKKRKLRYFEKKPKVNKRFKKNFTKLSNAEKECGKYTYIGNVQIRQDYLNEYNVIHLDENAINIRMGGCRDILDAASIIFGTKSSAPDCSTLTGNIEEDQKIHLVKGTIDFFLKSTSGHVVNVEIFEVSYKKGTPQSGISTTIAQSIASGNFEYRRLSPAGAPEDATYNLDKLGSKMEDLPDLWKYCTVKVHKLKLQPGDYAMKHFKVFGSKCYDASLYQTNDSPDYVGQGCKEFFFRVINDVTVSGNTSANKIHAFPSNNKGGIAVRYQKNYKLLSPNLEGITQKKIAIGNWCHQTETTDQQVLYYNPSGSAAIDT
ncbi:MAG: putative capsid protein [Arizlama virus AZLM_785]|nr:MAG: putative capsid protein [Arizlama virus]